MSEHLDQEDFPKPMEDLQNLLDTIDLPEELAPIFSGNVTVEPRRYGPFDNGFEVPVP